MSESANRMRQTYRATGDKWFLRAAEDIDAQVTEILDLRARLGIVITALRQLEEATGERFDDEGGDIAGIERELLGTDKR